MYTRQNNKDKLNEVILEKQKLEDLLNSLDSGEYI